MTFVLIAIGIYVAMIAIYVLAITVIYRLFKQLEAKVKEENTVSLRGSDNAK